MGRSHGAPWYYCYLPHGIAGGATSALIPLFAYALGGGLVEIGVVAAATSIASVPAFVLWGVLSDRLGRRKPFLLLGFLGTAGSFAAMASSSSILQLYAANVLMGFLGAAAGPVGTVLVMETSERKLWTKRLALLSRVGSIGWTAGVVVGVGWLATGTAPSGDLATMRVLFLLASVLNMVAALLAFAWLSEPLAKVDRRHVGVVDLQQRIERGRFLPMRMLHFLAPRDRGGPSGRLPRSLRVYLVSVFFLFAGFTGFYAFFPIFLTEELLLSSSEVFVVYLASHAASSIAYVRTSMWVDRWGTRPMQMYAALGRAALFPSFFVLAGLPLSPSARLGLILALHAGVGLCWAILNVAGATLVSRLAREEAHAQAMGAYSAMQGFGSIAGPLLMGFLAGSAGYALAFAWVVALIVTGIGILAVDRIPER